MSRSRDTARAVGGASGLVGAIMLAITGQLVTNQFLKIGGFAGSALTALVALYWLPWRRIWPALTDRGPDVPQDELATVAQQSGQWLEAMGTDGGGMIAAEWFRSHEPVLRTLLDTTDPTADRVDDLAQLADALDAWYVRRRDGAALLAVSERLTAIGEQRHRDDLRRLATLRAATAYRLLGDPQAADQRLAPEPRWRAAAAAALRTRWRVEQGLVHLAMADRCAPGSDRSDAIRHARACFDDASLTVPRADVAAAAAVHLNLAVTHLYDHRPNAALDHLRLAAARATEARDAGAEAHVVELTGVAAWLQDHRREAIGWWRQAEQRYADIDEQVGRARCRRHLDAAGSVT
jgi:hypothetical protein